MARIIALLIVIFELIAIGGSYKKRGIGICTYYTQLSNMVCLISSLLLLIFGQKYPVSVIRYLSVCMLVMTFFVTTCILIPMGKSAKEMLFTGRSFILHLLCPILSTLSYIFAENHVRMIWTLLPVCVTLFYGLLMVYLNHLGKVDGPYPFFRIQNLGGKATALWMAGLLAFSTVISVIVGYRPAPKTDIKYIFVHGLAGWGSYDTQNEFFPYWGLSGGDVIRYLTNHGYDSYAASVDPTGSAWDRACELYAQLYGTRVDYGEEHSTRCGHDRYGEDFTGRALVENFGESEFVLIGHSFGGATIRLFSQILKEGFPEEIAYTDADDISDFFKGGNGDHLLALVTLAAPTNGTTAYDLYEDPNFDVSEISIPEEYEKNSDAVSNGTRSEDDGRVSYDHAAYDMHIDNALALNSTIKTFDDVYYFAAPFASTVTDANGNVIADPDHTEQIFMKGSIIMSEYTGSTAGGFILDESWQANDGLVNTISAGAPFGEPSENYKEGSALSPGIWYVFDTFRGDHMSPQGGLTKRVNVKPYYLQLCELLASL
ncbi:MAG: hypothetical protein J6X94_00060 [Lachnospiraceae bacterium]|nr:hypothetical protein [Lachnospiraceae bacterium]